MFMKKLQSWGAWNTWGDVLGDWRHAEKGCWGHGWRCILGRRHREIYHRGGTLWWRATFQGQPTAGKGHSWGTVPVGRDILESLYSWVSPLRLRMPLGIIAIAAPCWGRGKPSTSEEETETIKHTTQNFLGHTFHHLRSWDFLIVTHGKNTGESDQEGRAQIREESLYFFVGIYL